MANQNTQAYVVSGKKATVWKTDQTTGVVLQKQKGGETDRLGRVKVPYGGTVYLTEQRAKDLGPDVVLPKEKWMAAQAQEVNAAITQRDEEIADLKMKLAELEGDKPKRGRKPAENTGE